MDKFTAKSASGDKEEIVKVRMQATPECIDDFINMLERCEDMGLCRVLNYSQLFRNKGTNKYFRAYSDVKVNKEESHE